MSNTQTNEIVKIGKVELTRTQACAIADAGHFIVTARTIFQVCWSNAQGTAYGLPVYKSDRNMAQRGRFHIMDAKAANSIIGFNLLVQV